MTDRPILFSAPMVRALLDGTKTQTRRLLPNPEYYGCPTGDCPHDTQAQCNQAMIENTADDLRFAIGDRLWVKETWRAGECWDHKKPSLIPARVPVGYLAASRADGPNGKTRVSIFMPRWASRLTLTVTDVRVQRLKEISEDDAKAEGILVGPPLSSMPESKGDIYHNGATDPIDGWTRSPVEAYRDLWEHINGPDTWDANPWIVAVSFDVERRNIDAIGEAV